MSTSTSGTTADPVLIRDAASVLLLREGSQGLEVFTLTRATTMAFAAGATVFPGGGVDPGDYGVPSPRDLTIPTSAEPTAASNDDQSLTLPVLAAAVRETFEESGVLLGLPAQFPLPDSAVRERARRKLEAHQLSIWEFFGTLGTHPDFSLLHRIGRWITPEGPPRRYDARFFLAELPDSQEAFLGTREAATAQWTTPQRALELFQRGHTHLMRPTEYLLTALRDFTTVDAALEALPLQERATRPRVE